MNEYSNITDAELKAAYIITVKLIAKYNNFQMAKKILLNALYGAMGNKGFRFFDPRIAEGITKSGQYFIRSVGDAIDDYIKTLTKDNKISTYYQDTDSVDYSSMIYVDNHLMAIGDFYESLSENPTTLCNGMEIKSGCGFTSIGFDGIRARRESIKYVMRHKVKKRMFNITASGNNVTVTEDHAIMIMRNGELLSSTVYDIMQDDKLILLKNGCNIDLVDFYTITDAGIQEEYVYDIEVEGVHNFFANDILVHNSCYVTLKPLVEKYILPKATNADGEIDIQQVIDAMDKICDQKLTPIINQACDRLSTYTNSFDQLMSFKREALADRGVWCCSPETQIVIAGSLVRLDDLWAKSSETDDMQIRSLYGDIENFDEFGMNDDHISHVYRKNYEGLLLSIEVDGKLLRLTPHHLVLVKGEKEYEWKEAQYLHVGDELICMSEYY